VPEVNPLGGRHKKHTNFVGCSSNGYCGNSLLQIEGKIASVIYPVIFIFVEIFETLSLVTLGLSATNYFKQNLL